MEKRLVNLGRWLDWDDDSEYECNEETEDCGSIEVTAIVLIVVFVVVGCCLCLGVVYCYVKRMLCFKCLGNQPASFPDRSQAAYQGVSLHTNQSAVMPASQPQFLQSVQGQAALFANKADIQLAALKSLPLTKS